jgi:putative ABC transport system substrate-binding protein
MDRRAFIGTLAGSVLAAEAQQPPRLARIGYLGTFPPGPQDVHWNAFVLGLRDHGYVEGQNLHIERRFSEGKAERWPAQAAELVKLGVSVIVTSAPGPSRAAKEATTTVPIVFVGVADPVGFGLVTSLARPGGNVTGLASIEWEAFQAKQLQVIKEALPTIARVAILVNPTTQMHALMLPQEQAAADRIGVRIQLVEARTADELEGAFAAAQRERADVVHVYGDALVFAQRTRVAELALKYKLPTMHFFREAVEAGGLLGFGPDWVLVYRNAGMYVDKILKGTKPADIPVAQPTKYELVINLKAAKALGLTIPPSLLQRADRVIE